MVIGQRYDAETQAQMTRSLRKRGEHELGLRCMRVAGHQVVFDEPHAVEAEPVGELDFDERIGIDVLLAAPEVRWHGELVEEIEQQKQAPVEGVS
jgi:hypothetical protein